MGATVRRTTVIRSDGDYAYERKDKAVRQVVDALVEELDCGLKASSLTVTTKTGSRVGSVKVEARLSMWSGR